MTDFFDNEVRYVGILRRHMVKALDSELSPHELGHGSYKYVYALLYQEGVTQKSLAERVGDDKAAATRVLARLQAQGLIRRLPDPNDGRATLIYLTDEGRSKRDIIKQALNRASDAITAGLTAQERLNLRALLKKAALPLV